MPSVVVLSSFSASSSASPRLRGLLLVLIRQSSFVIRQSAILRAFVRIPSRSEASMTTLITGGSGFIGANVARLLMARGEDRPVVFDRNSSPQRLDEIADRVEIVQGDLGNFSHVLHAVERSRPEVIFHLGGMLSFPSEADPAAALHANALGTYHVLEAARLFKVPKVLFSSTIATYGMDITEPVLTDDTIQRPELFYGITKVFGEQLG